MSSKPDEIIDKSDEISGKKEKIIKVIKELGNKTKKTIKIVVKIVKELKNKTKKAIEIVGEWRERRAQKKEVQEKKEQEEFFLKKQLSMLTTEEQEEVESAAYILSRKWKYHKLMRAANLESARVEGREVHGYMMRMFRHRYDWLIENDVFDYAVNFALDHYQPEVFNVVKHYNFDDAIINVVFLPRKTNFDIYREYEFDRIIILTQDEPFENAVYWIENYPWVDERGYSTTKTLAPCNLLNTGFTLWDLPVTILKDTVGKDKMFFEAKTTADQIGRVREQILKKHIYTKRQEEETANEKYLEMEIKFDQLKDRHQYLIDDIRAGDTRDPEEKLKDFAKKYDKEISYTSNFKKVILGIIIVFLVVFVVVGIMTMKPPESEVVDVPSTAMILLLNMFYRGC